MKIVNNKKRISVLIMRVYEKLIFPVILGNLMVLFENYVTQF